MNSQPIQYAFHMNNKENNPFPSQNNFTSNNICALANYLAVNSSSWYTGGYIL